MLLCHSGELLVDGVDQGLHLRALKHRLTDCAGLQLPGLEERVTARLRDGGGDRRQLLIGLGVDSGVDGHNEIGFEVRDLVDLNPVVEAQHHRLCRAEFGCAQGHTANGWSPNHRVTAMGTTPARASRLVR